MPDQSTISRIAKILARAGSDNQNEASAALEGAYKRMVRDGVTVSDLLTLPIAELYQDTLVKLIDVILADKPGLSPSARREAYAEYMRLIVARFPGASEGRSTGAANQGRSREEEAREYEERRAREEDSRNRGEQGRGWSAQDGGASEREDSGTQREDKVYTWSIRNRTFSFSPGAFWRTMRPFFERGSLFSSVLHDPLRGLRLFCASLLWGGAFAMVLLTLGAIAHSVTGTAPLVDVRFKSVFSFLTALGAIWKARALFRQGWFRA